MNTLLICCIVVVKKWTLFLSHLKTYFYNKHFFVTRYRFLNFVMYLRLTMDFGFYRIFVLLLYVLLSIGLIFVVYCDAPVLRMRGAIASDVIWYYYGLILGVGNLIIYDMIWYVGPECSERLGDVWCAADSLWRTSQFLHIIAAILDALWQVSSLMESRTLTLMENRRVGLNCPTLLSEICTCPSKNCNFLLVLRVFNRRRRWRKMAASGNRALV